MTEPDTLLAAAAREGFELDADSETLLLSGLPTDLRILQEHLCLRVCEREVIGVGRQPIVQPGELGCAAVFEVQGPRLELMLPATLWRVGTPDHHSLLTWLRRHGFGQDWKRSLLLQVREATDNRLLEIWTDTWWRTPLEDVRSTAERLRSFREDLPRPRRS